MTDQLRKLAEAEAKNEFHPDRQPFNLYDARRSGYVRGFIAGRTSVTWEQIVEAMYAAYSRGFKSVGDLASAVELYLKGELE